MRNAQSCMKQARLVALQLHFISAGVKVIHMSDEGADQFIKSHPRFSEVKGHFMINHVYHMKHLR